MQNEEDTKAKEIKLQKEWAKYLEKIEKIKNSEFSENEKAVLKFLEDGKDHNCYEPKPAPDWFSPEAKEDWKNTMKGAYTAFHIADGTGIDIKEVRKILRTCTRYRNLIKETWTHKGRVHYCIMTEDKKPKVLPSMSGKDLMNDIGALIKKI